MRRLLWFLFAALAWPATGSAQQVLETAGSRALGMGGAFVGVADDATAVYWNPAGLVSGPPAGMTIGWVDFRTGDQGGVPAPGPTERSSKFVSLGTWPVGLSYGRFQESTLTSPIGSQAQADTFAVSEFGATLLQTVAPGLVVATTLKYLRGSVVSGPIDGPTSRDALNAAGRREASTDSRFDADIGVMADLRRVRLGLLLRNLRQPTFGGDEESAVTLRRQARLGVAVLPTSGLTLAMDVDLDSVPLRDGPRRIVAIGGEQRFGRVAVRAGSRWNLEGSRRVVGAVGSSVLIRPRLWVDAHYSEGRLDADRGFGVALRVGY